MAGGPQPDLPAVRLEDRLALLQAVDSQAAAWGNDRRLLERNQLYRQAFEFHNMGYASALAWILFLIILGLTILVFRGSKRLVYYEGLKT